jgi:hypothetical protein
MRDFHCPAPYLHRDSLSHRGQIHRGACILRTEEVNHVDFEKRRHPQKSMFSRDQNWSGSRISTAAATDGWVPRYAFDRDTKDLGKLKRGHWRAA